MSPRSASTPADSTSRGPRWLRPALFVLALVLGALRAWALRDLQRGDSISYLEIAQAYARGDWAHAISSFWSPLYPWLLGVVLRVFRPSPESEFTALSLLGYVFYLALLLAFLFFWRSLEGEARARWVASPESLPVPLHDVAWLLLGYAFFFWAALEMMRIGLNMTDMLLTVFVLLAAGILVRLRFRPSRSRDFVALGVLLGFGYLTKAVMFPLVPVFLTVAAVNPPPATRSWRRFALAPAVFLLLAVPWIVTLSRHTGRLTWSDTGALNHAWIINRAPMFHWQGDPPGTGTPLHPTRRISEVPVAFEFASPVLGSYPYWYDPTYWTAGLRPHLDLARTWTLFLENTARYLFLQLTRADLLLAGFLIFLAPAGLSPLRSLASRWFLLLPAVAGLGLYGLIHFEPRHAAPFLLLFWGAVLSSVQIAAARWAQRALAFVVGMVVVASLMHVVLAAPSAWNAIRSRPERVHWQAARKLQEMGVAPGGGIATFGDTLLLSGTAHLAQVRIVAEIEIEELPNFWAISSQQRADLLRRMESLGVRAVLFHCHAGCPAPPACTRFPNTSLYAKPDLPLLLVCRPQDFYLSASSGAPAPSSDSHTPRP